MIKINDIHTHCNNLSCQAIVSLSPTQFDKTSPRLCSIGIHPWESNSVKQKELLLLQELSTHPFVVAIGECGIDRMKGADIKLQTDLFEQHIILSEKVKKPLIIHAVKSADLILALHQKYKPTQTWIIHGYRGNATTAQQYIRRGIELSYGEKFNPEAVVATPMNMLWIESDESSVDINQIYNSVAQAANIEAEELKKLIEKRAKGIFLGCD